ncbi:MAG: T9SS type A sorting domain-containing protein [Bacteroidales bacterium]|nr:T9SS type A sorting domain-containing protein [Bacteroidales bacterium]
MADKLTVEAQEAVGTVEIYNLMGALVYSQKNCGNKVEINIANLQSGIYFVRHISSDGVSIRSMVKE